MFLNRDMEVILLACRKAVGKGYCGDPFRFDLILAVASVISRNLK